jgi:Putative Actinobacterial Holin-X, holin superfamily III
MEPSKLGGNSILGLFKQLARESKIFVREEIQLAKTELSEKVSSKAKSGTNIVIGGFVAYAGLIVFLIGLGWIIGFALTKAGLEPLLAQFIGLAFIGVVIAGSGAFLLMKALKAMKAESVVPERTVHTLQELRGKQPEPLKKSEVEVLKPKVSSQELEKRVEHTEERMNEMLEELQRRVKPSYINAQIKGRLSEKPYRNSLVAVVLGVVSGFFVRAKLRRA